MIKNEMEKMEKEYKKVLKKICWKKLNILEKIWWRCKGMTPQKYDEMMYNMFESYIASLSLFAAFSDDPEDE